jgi:uncharacterized membrane protein
MEYLLIIALQVIGIALHIMQKIGELDDKHPDKPLSEIRVIFWREDYNTVIVSGLVLFLNLIVHFIIASYSTLPTIDHYHLYAFGTAFVLGYAGQRLIYRYLGTAEKYLGKKVENKLQ